MICGVVIVARCKANRFLDRNRERKKRRWIQWWRKRREKEDRRRIENRNVIILSTALFTGEKRTIADPGGAHFHCRKSGGANAVVTRRFPLTCCPRVRVPRVFVAVGHEPCERDPCQNWIRWIRSVPRTSCSPLLVHRPKSPPDIVTAILTFRSRLFHLFQTFRFDRPKDRFYFYAPKMVERKL